MVVGTILNTTGLSPFSTAFSSLDAIQIVMSLLFFGSGYMLNRTDNAVVKGYDKIGWFSFVLVLFCVYTVAVFMIYVVLLG